MRRKWSASMCTLSFTPPPQSGTGGQRGQPPVDRRRRRGARPRSAPADATTALNGRRDHGALPQFVPLSGTTKLAYHAWWPWPTDGTFPSYGDSVQSLRALWIDNLSFPGGVPTLG